MTENYPEERPDNVFSGTFVSYTDDDDSYGDYDDYTDSDSDSDVDYDDNDSDFDDSRTRRTRRSDDEDDLPGYAIAVSRIDGGGWDLTKLSDRTLENFDLFEKELRKIRAEGPLFGLLNCSCDYFVIARPTPNGLKMFVSDIDAATEEDLVIEALEEQGIDIEGDDEWDDWAVGDYDILQDLGLSESILSVIVDDEESWADEQIMEIAENLGFEDELDRLV